MKESCRWKEEKRTNGFPVEKRWTRMSGRREVENNGQNPATRQLWN